MKVTLLNHNGLELAYKAAKICIGVSPLNAEASVEKMQEFLKDKILTGTEMDPAHESVIEHLVYTFHIEGVSRALLQQMSRHRLTSPSVESTRFALKKILKKVEYSKEVDSLLVLTGDSDVDSISKDSILRALRLIKKGINNDELKYCLPEAFKTNLMISINARSLRNLLVSRTKKSGRGKALKEFRDLAYCIFESIPEDHQFIFSDRLQ